MSLVKLLFSEKERSVENQTSCSFTLLGFLSRLTNLKETPKKLKI